MIDDKQKYNMLYTIGHSTRKIEDFISILSHHAIDMIADVRTIPRSRYNPQFNKDALAYTLNQAGIGYEHFPGLGGLRHARRDSLNSGWRNLSFRGFADYMQTEEFKIALEELIHLSTRFTVAIMCAEAVPWRCHRSLISDALLIRGLNVYEIISLSNVRIHSLTPWARVVGEDITYPLPEE
ncbi:MAG: DUF488 family protein [Candidatus Kryptoniota bacterium]